jgi:hypothetical protein
LVHEVTPPRQLALEKEPHDTIDYVGGGRAEATWRPVETHFQT